MPKKKPAAPAPTIIDLSVPLERGEYGFGALPGASKHYSPGSIDADVAQLAAQDMQTQVVSLRELAEDGVEGADVALHRLVEDDSAEGWLPAAPAGDGWLLVAVVHNEVGSHEGVDALAIWARPAAAAEAEQAQPETPAPEAETAGADDELLDGAPWHAEHYLIAKLMLAARRRLCDLAVPWRQLSQHEQARTLRGLATDVQQAVKEAARAIATNERLAFRASVESVTFKGEDTKATLKLMPGGTEAHNLADVAGGFVTVVIETVDHLLEIPDSALAGEPDQPELFSDAPATPEAALAAAVEGDDEKPVGAWPFPGRDDAPTEAPPQSVTTERPPRTQRGREKTAAAIAAQAAEHGAAAST